jgi:hypothetical protein
MALKFNGIVNIKASRQVVWDYLTDPNKVTQCAPGVQSVEVNSADAFRVVAGIGFGTVKVTFDNDVAWAELDAPTKAVAKIHGKAPGSAMDAIGTMELSDADDGTTNMNWQAEINILGQIANLAARLAGPMAKQLTGAFFNCVRKNVETQN